VDYILFKSRYIGILTLEGIVVTVSLSDYVNWLCVVSGALLCVWAEFIMLATNRTEAW